MPKEQGVGLVGGTFLVICSLEFQGYGWPSLGPDTM